ncbi:hypothetical protein QYE76_057414 [Lolium multiflorum]|uniref:Retrotransposon gag domain-containing protein n=1 Tax=Lolium multiflorum TaxID=4521 RepID=A0AAD8T501_LOLMU|nr:hypothetical protein QYE76_057414 [Lolium multiflorum]
MSRVRPHRDSSSEEILSAEEMVARAVLNKPITPGDAADLEALEATRKEMLATAKKLADTEAALREEREICRIPFNTPAEHQPLETPKDNMQKAAELLKKKDEEVDINSLSSAMQQQSKADTSRRPRPRTSPSRTQSLAGAVTGVAERPVAAPVAKAATEPERTRKGEEIQMAEARSRTAHLAGLPHHHPAVAAEVEAEAMVEISLSSKSPRHAARRAIALTSTVTDYIGLKCFGRMIREEPKPRMNLKLPGNLKHYDGTERPDTWIEDYYNVVTFAGGTPNIACRMLQLYLVGPARIWLSDLEKNSIFCWFDLKNAFEKHFRGTYKRPATTSDLQACIQKKGETSRNFLTRWLACRNECENVDNRTAMHAFIGGLQRGGLLRHKLTCLVNANKLTLDDMITIASDHTAADDDAGGDLAATAIPLHQQKKNRDNGSSSSHKRKNPDDQKSGGSEMVAMAKSTHTNRNCKWVNDLKNDPEAGYKRAQKHRPRGKGGKGKNKDKEDDSSEAMDEDDNSPDPKAGSAGKSNPFDKKSVGAYHTFLGTPTVRASKSATRILNAIVPAVPQYVRWSEIPCTFDRKDRPAIVPKECYALVVSPRIDGYDFSKCLMDGGASLNIMYLETLERMNLTKEQLKHSNTEFHGVVPGKKANSLGSITLPVAFGDVHNFREERITFEFVPFKSSYHVIFGRPTYHKFHARACYIYNKLKIPGPKSRGGPTEMQTTKKQISEQKTSFKAAIETKKHDLIKGDSSKQRCLKDQIGRNVHAYVDDIAVMTRKGSDLISDLTETFDNLRRFVSRLGEKALPLYKLLKKTDKFVWDDAADAALRGLKEILTSPPILAAPAESEPMLLYLAATNKVISLVIVVE